MEMNYPKNIIAEQMLLGGLLKNNKLFHQVSASLKADHFYEPLHQRIYAAISQKINEGSIVTPVTLKLEFDQDETLWRMDGAEYLHRLAVQGDLIVAIKDYAYTVIALSKRRRLMNLGREMINDAQNILVSRSVEEIESDITKQITEIAIDSPVMPFETSKNVAKRISKNMKLPMQSYSTGVSALDDVMLGGMQAKRMYSIAGRMKDGKSIWATTLAYNMANLGTKVLFLTLEMENDEIQTRWLARKMQIKPSKFFYQRDNAQFQQEVDAAADDVNENAILCYEPDITFERLKQRLHYAVHNRGVKGFILDQWQLVGGKKKGDTTANHLSEVAQWLAGFCKNEQVFGLVVCQLNKDGTTLDSEGIKRAVDQHFKINRCADDEFAWLDLEISRYTAKMKIGSEDNPRFRLNLNGLFFDEIYKPKQIDFIDD